MKKDNRTAMRKAIDYLIANGEMRSDSDLVKEFNLSKGTISTYINKKPGKEFQRLFEEKYKIKLADFSNNVSRANSQEEPTMSLTDLAGYVIKNQAILEVLIGCVAELLAEKRKGSATAIARELERVINQRLKYEVEQKQ